MRYINHELVFCSFGVKGHIGLIYVPLGLVSGGNSIIHVSLSGLLDSLPFWMKNIL